MTMFEKIKSLNINPDSYVVLSGNTLEAYGIRKSGDIDIHVKSNIYKQFKLDNSWFENITDDGRRILEKNDFEMSDSFFIKGKYEPTFEYLRENAVIINEIPFMNLQEVLKFKNILKRDKDIKDIQLIETYLSEN